MGRKINPSADGSGLPSNGPRIRKGNTKGQIGIILYSRGKIVKRTQARAPTWLCMCERALIHKLKAPLSLYKLFIHSPRNQLSL